MIQESVSGKKESKKVSKSSSKPRINKWVRLRESQELREIGSSFFYITVKIRNITGTSWRGLPNVPSIELVSKEEWWKFSGIFRESQVICIRAVWYEGDPEAANPVHVWQRAQKVCVHACNWRLARRETLSRGPNQSVFWKDAGVTREVYGRCRTCLAPWRMGKNTCPCWRAKGSLDSRKDGTSVKVYRWELVCPATATVTLASESKRKTWIIAASEMFPVIGTVLCAEHTQFPAVIS